MKAALLVALVALSCFTATLLAQNPPVRIMPLGDSITNGISGTGGYRKPLYDSLVAAGYNVDFVGTQTSNGAATFDSDHQGHSGWRIDQLDTNIEGWFNTIAGPDVILLHIGTNDFGQNFSTSTAIDRLDAFILKMTTLRPGAHIIVTNLMVRGEPQNTNIQNLFNPFVQARVAAHAAAGRKVTFLDMRSAVPLSDMPDNLHPDQTGYNKMAAAWLPAIQAVITPQGDLAPPVISRALGQSDGRSVSITFSKQVDDVTATNLSNYIISDGITLNAGGATPSTIALSADKYTVTITPSGLPVFNYGITYTVSVSNVVDRYDPPHPIAANSAKTFTRSIARGYLANIPESSGYTLVQSIDIPTSPNYVTNAQPAYAVDNRSYINQFSRVAYYLELQRPGGDIQYAWVSMDAFTADINKIGIPTFASGAVFQQGVSNLNVVSNVPGVLNAAGTSGNVEFFPNNYSAGSDGSLGGSTTLYDFDDTRSTTGSYGSMQVHNTTDQKTVFAINNFGAGNVVDIGIGNNPIPTNNGVDWTFAVNGGNYFIKTLYVLVQNQNDNTSPTIVSAAATAGRNRIYLKFSEPVSGLSIDANQFILDNGVTVLGHTLADNQVDLVLHTTQQPANIPLTLNVSGVRDTSPSANRIAPNTAVPVSLPALPPEIAANVGSAAQNYELVYSIELPTIGNLRARGKAAYHWDDSAATHNFTRVAYYLELQKPNQASQYIWVSMDKLSGDRRKLGIPLPDANVFHQQNVANMEVVSNVSGITNGANIATGNIEFWPTDYGVENDKAIPNADATKYDWGDLRRTTGSFGSMQIHNHGASQNLFAINHWGADGSTLDIGIGNNPSTASNNGPDWTNAANAGQYSKKILHVLVLPGSPPTPEPVATTVGPEAQGYQLVYSLDIPSEGNLLTPNYSVNNSALVGPFKRIGYYMQLQTGTATPQYVWVSVDAFTTDVGKIAVPTTASGAVFQQILNNMTVVSNKAGVVNGTNIATGNIEFWPTDYTSANGMNIPGASATIHDFGDTRSTTGSHGSIQIHNHGGPAPHTLFAISNWGSTTVTNKISLGIGNGTGTHPDWTFANNSATYSSRLLQVYVLPGDPDNIGPMPVRAVGSTNLNRLVVTLSEPIADSSALLANFNIAGLTIDSITLLPDKKDVILTTSSQTPGAVYAVNVSNLRDRSPNGNLSPANASASFMAYTPPAILSTIPETSGYDLVYQVALPAARPQWNINDIPYSVDEAKYGERSFSRVAYVMELDSQWVFVSFDAHTNQISKIGIPTSKVTSTAFQQMTSNLTVAKSAAVTNVTAGNFPTGGNIEFWNGNYSTANARGIPNADIGANRYDWGDTMSAGGHACIQVHNHAQSQVIFAYNNWGSNSGSSADLGIGNRPTGDPDWTSSGSSISYTIRNLYVLAQPGPSIPGSGTGPTIFAQPVSRTVAAGTNVTFAVNAAGTAPLSYQWYRNHLPLTGATLPWLDIPAVTAAQAGTYHVVVKTASLIATNSNAAVLTVTNGLPTFSGFRFTTGKDQPVQISAAALLANTSDPDNDEVSIVSVPAASSAVGSAAFAGGVLTYTPQAGYIGPDSLTLTIADENGAQAQGPIHITVVPKLPIVGVDSVIATRVDGKVDAVFRVANPGESYLIQRSTSLMPNSWENIGTVIAGDDGLIPVHDAVPPISRGFYRAVLVED